MLNRRKFIFLASGTATLPLLMNHALAGAQLQINYTALKATLYKNLLSHFPEQRLSKNIADYVINVGVDWSVPLIDVTKINRIVAYAFGNRPNAESGSSAGSAGSLTGMPDPGPINEMLADTIYEIYQRNPVKIYAQWEIARFLKSKYKLGDIVHSVEPIKNPDGTIKYLSTVDIAQDIIKQEKNAQNMGIVAIVAHRDHAKRCVLTSKECGMNAFVVKEIDLPVNYDPKSGQPWTRDRETYLLHDMYAQMADLRAKRIQKLYPNG